jgi:hypothetical protein
MRENSCLIYVICVCGRANVVFTLFVFVGGALVLFTLFVFVEELMSCLRYLCLWKSSCRIYPTNTNNVNKTRAPPTNTNDVNKTKAPPTNTNKVIKTRTPPTNTNLDKIKENQSY